MDAIARRTEENVCCEPPLRKRKKEQLSITAAMAHAACTTALDVGADAILTVSQRGLTAQMVSRFRPGHNGGGAAAGSAGAAADGALLGRGTHYDALCQQHG